MFTLRTAPDRKHIYLAISVVVVKWMKEKLKLLFLYSRGERKFSSYKMFHFVRQFLVCLRVESNSNENNGKFTYVEQ